MNLHLVYCARASVEREGNRLHQADLQMILDEQMQLRLAGYMQGVIELYTEELEAEKSARKDVNDASDTEMEDEAPKRKKKGKRANGEAAKKDTSGKCCALWLMHWLI